ncbi:transglutaminase-like cysteine peptidase [Rhizobium sp. CC-YZS058]|uniref:transglutaminase-like cysteine peptidase n=1 Tax=Rhizobium sp. CC-YZS058 TaxID=3042153 RepID=UPI002B05F63A|nr:transglutaminase-like cysteine peptidase [Rhizobium sp. CC-YZS058]MEA3535464.1 transglutaminase-like cysteine peptidase [Rhizobium sp. CC-YZS058]
MKRMTKTFTLAACSLVAMATMALGAPAQRMMPPGLKSPYLSTGRPSMAPFAFVRFCVANADDCTASDGEDTIVMSPERVAQLKSINGAVNRAITPQYDQVSLDRWQADVTAGDCEDYALTKRRRLIGAGFAPAALRIAVARTWSGEGHAVLVVRTDRGDVVLDNRFDQIKRWNATDMRILKIQSGANPRLWFEL